MIVVNNARPQIRADIVFGPPELSAGNTVYYVKDKATNWFYRIGAREHFLITRMDGQRTLQQIGEEYSQQFGRCLGAQAWQNLFELLDKRQILIETASSERIAELRHLVEQRKRAENKRLFRRRFRLVNPDAFLGTLLPWLQWMFHPAFVVSVLLLTVALEAAVALNLDAIVTTARSTFAHPAIFVAFLAALWLATMLHEVAHGLACKRFGGSTTEIGILWRYFSLFPYCKLDDVVLFHNRWHRVYTAFAGMFASFVLLIPVGVLWWLLPAGYALREFSALFLSFFNLSILLNLIPFIELDGYFMLSYALGMADLRKESYRFWSGLVDKLLLHRGDGVRHYPRSVCYVYGIYGVLSLVVTAYFLLAVAVYWFITLQRYVGSLVTWSAFALVACFLIYHWFSQRWLKRQAGVSV